MSQNAVLGLLGDASLKAITFQHEIVGQITNAGELCRVTRDTVGSAEGVHMESPLLTLAELYPQAVWSRACAAYKNTQVATIGTWGASDGAWSFSLVLARSSPIDPFTAYAAPELWLVAACSSNGVSLYADITVSLDGPKHYGREGDQPKFGFAVLQNEHFERSSAVKVWSLGLSLWQSSLEYHAMCSTGSFCIYFDITSTIAVTHSTCIFERYPDVLNLIAEKLDLEDISFLRATSSFIRTDLASMSERRLRRAFQPYFFDNVPAFCAALRRYHAVVGGSTMLSIVRPGAWEPEDLDIVVHHQYASYFERFLVAEGFKEDKKWSRAPQLLYPATVTEKPPVSIRFQYKCYKRDGRKIDLCIIFDSMSPGAFILTYHSTAVMNLYDGRSIYCLFPDQTFDGVFIRNKYTPTPKLEKGLAKLRKRGYVECETPFGPYLQDWLPHGPNGELTIHDLPANSIWCQRVDL